MFDYIFFDLDGTLTDPFLGITNAVKYALKKYNIDKDNSELKCYIGPPLRDSFMEFEGFSYEKACEAIVFYREYFSTIGLYENTLFDETIEVLEELKKQNKKIVLATSKPDKFSIEILKHFNIYKYFDFIACATFNETRTKKHEVIEYAINELKIKDLSKILMVGDRFHDIEGAKKNNIKSCGVTFGYGSYEELKNAGADYIIDNLKDLYKII